MIQMDEVVGDVGELLRGEAELRRLDILALGGLNGDVAIDGKKTREVKLALNSTPPIWPKR